MRRRNDHIIIRDFYLLSEGKCPKEACCSVFTRKLNGDPYPYKYDHELSKNEISTVVENLAIAMYSIFSYKPNVLRELPKIEDIKKNGETHSFLYKISKKSQSAGNPRSSRSYSSLLEAQSSINHGRISHKKISLVAPLMSQQYKNCSDDEKIINSVKPERTISISNQTVFAIPSIS